MGKANPEAYFTFRMAQTNQPAAAEVPGAIGRAAVATARCISYDLSRVRGAVERCVDSLPELQHLFARSRSVLLKPNLLSSRRGPEHHVNTHPAVVQALAELLTTEFECDVAIGDSCGTLTAGSTAAAIRNSQMDRVAELTGARIYNVDAQPRHVVPFGEGRVYTAIPLPSNLQQFDLIVSVAKVKTHNLTYVTGPVKNLLGLVPGAAKKQAHLLAPRVDEFATLLCDLYALVRPGAAFADGIVGMEGNGPNNGKPRRLELIGASCDAVALDSFCAQVMGFDPMAIPLLAECHERGLGMANPGGIAVRGEPAAAFAPGDFARPRTYALGALLRLVPKWLFRTGFGAFAARHASIDQGKCSRCGECERNCPSGAISFDESSQRYRVDARKCIACYCCDEVCPSDAILIRGAWLQRAWERLASPLT